MRLITTALALGMIAATPAFAAERLSDAAYIAAARCEGVLGAKADPSLKSLIKEQGRARHDYVQDRALGAKDAGRREAKRDTAVASCSRYAAKDSAALASTAAPTSQP